MKYGFISGFHNLYVRLVIAIFSIILNGLLLVYASPQKSSQWLS